jgi:hypothetical protein
MCTVQMHTECRTIFGHRVIQYQILPRQRRKNSKEIGANFSNFARKISQTKYREGEMIRQFCRKLYITGPDIRASTRVRILSR